MSCVFQGCKSEIKASCKICSNRIYFCCNHTENHQIQTGHLPKNLSTNELKIILLKALKIQIKRCIVKMSKDTSEIIETLNKSSLQAIKNLKKVNQNLKNVFDFIPDTFDRERISFLVNEARLIDQSMEFSPQSQIKTLRQKLAQVDEICAAKSDSLTRSENEIKNLWKKLTVKDEMLNERQQEIEYLKKNFQKSLVKNSKDMEFIEKQLDNKNKELVENFNQSILKDKQAKLSSTLSLIGGKRSQDKELLKSHDGKYLFRCIQELGKCKRDCRLNSDG